MLQASFSPYLLSHPQPAASCILARAGDRPLDLFLLLYLSFFLSLFICLSCTFQFFFPNDKSRDRVGDRFYRVARTAS